MAAATACWIAASSVRSAPLSSKVEETVGGQGSSLQGWLSVSPWGSGQLVPPRCADWDCE